MRLIYATVTQSIGTAARRPPRLYHLVENVGTDGTSYTGVEKAANAYGPLSIGVLVLCPVNIDRNGVFR